jgi:hypothetical protein
MVQLLCLVGWRTKIQNDKVGAYLSFANKDIFLPPKNQASHFNALLTSLSDATQISHRLAQSKATSPWQSLLTRNIRHQQIIICSDKSLLREQDLEELQRLSKYNLIHWISIEDEHLDQLPEGQYRLQDMQGIQTIQITKTSMQSYKENRLIAKQKMNNQLSRIGIPFHYFALHESPVQIARHLMAFGALS